MKFLFILIILTFVPEYSAGYTIKKAALSIGETFVYDISVFGAKVATEKIVVKSITNIKGFNCYFVYTTINTTPFVSSVYKVADEIYSYIDTNTLLPVLIKSRLNEGSWHNNIIIDIDINNKKVRYKDKRIDKIYRYKDKFLGLVSILFYIRQIIPESGEIISITVHNQRTIVPIQAETGYIKKRRFRINNRIKYYNILTFNSSDQSGAELWVTDDKLRLPVKLMSIKIPVFGVMYIRFKNTLREHYINSD